jgi:hypothetical protein
VLDLDELTPEGRAALESCRGALRDEALRRNVALVETFVEAVDHLARLRARYRRMRSPATYTSPRGVLAEHPLSVAIRRQGAHVAALAVALRLPPAGARGANTRAPDVKAREPLRRVV